VDSPGVDAVERQTHDHDAADVASAAEQLALEADEAHPTRVVQIRRAGATVEPERGVILRVQVAIREEVFDRVFPGVGPRRGTRRRCAQDAGEEEEFDERGWVGRTADKLAQAHGAVHTINDRASRDPWRAARNCAARMSGTIAGYPPTARAQTPGKSISA
jgi:hypothetical protein